jgi:plasmid maintenance system antidote protein VapI
MDPTHSQPTPADQVTADDMAIQVGARFIPWPEFWALMDEQADILHARTQPATRTEGGVQ